MPTLFFVPFQLVDDMEKETPETEQNKAAKRSEIRLRNAERFSAFVGMLLKAVALGWIFCISFFEYRKVSDTVSSEALNSSIPESQKIEFIINYSLIITSAVFGIMLLFMLIRILDVIDEYFKSHISFVSSKPLRTFLSALSFLISSVIFFVMALGIAIFVMSRTWSP